MKRLLRCTLLAVALATGAARAATLDITNVQNLSLAPFATGLSFTTPPGTMLDLGFVSTLAFTLDAPAVVELRAEAQQLQAFALAAPALPAVASESDADTRIARGVLGPGEYVATVSGTFSGGGTTGYAFFAAAIAAIPEPHAWMLVLAGLACAAVVMSRRG